LNISDFYFPSSQTQKSISEKSLIIRLIIEIAFSS
jgi:hypothetical protein